MPLVEFPILWLHADVEHRFLAVPARPWEVGGWLLGYWKADGRTVFVTHATPPGPRGWPWGVRISGAGHRERFDAAWTASAGSVTFLGDWHSHPGGPATPSVRDRAAMEKLATDDNYGTPQPLAAIIATPRWPWSDTRREVQFILRGADNSISTLPYSVTGYLPAAAARVPTWPWPT